MSAILRAALDYAARGWPVVPLEGKVPWVRSWVTAASTDPATIRGWWRSRGDSNVGLVTGPRAGFWVLDVDAGRDGLVTLEQLEQEHGRLDTRRARTGSGGLHLFFRLPADLELGNRVDVLPGIDVRATGGQVVAVPSVHPETGTAYSWEDIEAMAEAPAWLVDLVRPVVVPRVPYVPPTVIETSDRERRFVSQGLVGACTDIAGAGEGARHKLIHGKAVKLGGYIAAGLIDEALVVDELQRAGEACGKAPKEVAKAIRDGIVAGKARPLRPELREVTTTPTMGEAEALAWWAANPEMSSGEAAQALGIKAAILREWSARGRLSPAAPEVVHPEEWSSHAPDHAQEPRDGQRGDREADRPRARDAGAPAPLGDPRGRADRDEGVADGRGGRHAAGQGHPGGAPAGDPPDVHGGLEVEHGDDDGGAEGGELDPIARVVAARAAVAAGASKSEKAAPLYDLLGDRDWIEAMVAARMADATAGLAELARAGDGFHGARQLVAQIELAIKERKKAVVDAAKAAMRQPPAPPPPPDDGDGFSEEHEEKRPELLISTNMPRVLGAAIRALRDDKELPLYQRGGLLVHLTRDASPKGLTWDPDAPCLRPVRHARLREMMSASADWKQAIQTPKGWEYKAALPPTWTVDGVLARDEWPFRRAQGVTEIPILRPDGSLHEAPGYDAVSGYIHEPPAGLKLRWPRVQLDQEIANAAWLRLAEPFADFPFADPWHMAAAVSALLSLVARPAIDGPVPLFPFLSTTPKSGKTLMVEMLHYIAAGRDIPRAVPGSTEEEIEKRITTIALSGFSAVLFDNLTGTFGGPSLDAAVQGRTWRGRILGRSEMVTIPISTVWMVTGNNLAIKGDLAQRVIPIQLEPEVERPELRTDFRIPNLRAYVREHRADLLAAAFTLLRAHALAGRPTTGTFGGYQEWNEIVRSAMVWAGAPDPYQGVAQLAEVADETRVQTRALLETWYETFGPREVYLAELPEHLAAGRYTALFETVKAMAATRDGSPDLQRLGYLLRKAAGRIYGGFQVNRSDGLRHGVRAWSVTKRDAAGEAIPPQAKVEDDIPY